MVNNQLTQNQATGDKRRHTKYEIRFTLQEIALYNGRESSTNRPCFMQNKANLLNAQMNVSSVLTKYYENVPLHRRRENKAKQTQSFDSAQSLP
jgi:hypothetical protein